MLKNYDPNYNNNATNVNYQLVVLYGLKAMMKDPLTVAKGVNGSPNSKP
jgi:hypothetical protein